MNHIARLIALAAAFLLSACLPESVNPIAPARMNVDDLALEGTWRARDKDATSFYHMHHSKQERRGWMKVEAVNVPRGSGEMDRAQFEFASAQIAGGRYLSFFEVKPGKPRRFTFARYDFDWRGRLRLFIAEEAAFAAAVRAGKLRGKVTTGSLGDSVEITDTSERIAAFVAASKPSDLFGGEPMLLERVR